MVGPHNNGEEKTKRGSEGTSFSVSSEGTSWNVKHKKLIPPLSFPLLLYLFFSHFQKLKANYTLSLSLPLVFPSFVFFFNHILYYYFTHFFFFSCHRASSLKRKEGDLLDSWKEQFLLFTLHSKVALSLSLSVSPLNTLSFFFFSLFLIFT